MGLFNRLFLRLKPQSPHQAPGAIPAQQGQTLNATSTPSAPPIKTIAALEQEMQAQAQAQQLQARAYRQKSARPGKPPIIGKLIWAALLLGLPAGALWVINLPYPPIRGAIARKAPVLLLPSYISMDSHYRQAIVTVEQAKQFIDAPTSATDLDLGEQKVNEAQDHLNALPVELLGYFPEYRYWWYDWRFSASGIYSARAEISRLQAKVIQEKNAQTLLFDADQTLNTAKQQYQQATTSVDKDGAIAAWRSSLDQLEQISSQTLAGRTAQQKLAAYQRDFQETVGLAAGNARTATLIEAARQFAWKAAQAGQNPPHSVQEWEQVEILWEEAIARLEQISADDLAGYAEAQKQLATYHTYLGQIQIRQQAEQDSAIALQQAERDIQMLVASTSSDISTVDFNATASQLQGIINQLERVEDGTTSYLEAQKLLVFAQNKLNQVQP